MANSPAVNESIAALAAYALKKGLIAECEYMWAVNSILDVLRLDGWEDPGPYTGEAGLAETLSVLLDDACARGVLAENSVVYRDLLDSELMGRLTPRPAQVIERFNALYAESPKAATDWYYAFSQDTNYIRRDRIAKDVQWKTETEYGEIDITINLSKPEKDPKAIAAARNLPASDYPRCQLCAENEGYAGRVNHPARQNHRIIPITISGKPWYLQYSPYVYYNEHCICLNRVHTPMKIDRDCFAKLLDFVRQFPHYFVGSNADLPIVGGSILAHDHFQGGRYTFAMERAEVETPFVFPGYEDVSAGIVKWPMSVVRIRSADPERLVSLADRILGRWRGYTDESAMILAETDGVPHNTITPIARRRGADYELDLVLRNNLTTPEHPLGLYHPHAELHHIKKEEHRANRGHGPRRAARAAENRAGRRRGLPGGRNRPARERADGKARRLGRGLPQKLLHHGRKRQGHSPVRDRPGVRKGAGTRRRVQAHTGRARGLPSLP